MFAIEAQPTLDARSSFQHDGFISMPGFVRQSDAEQIHGCLRHHLPWGLAYRLDGQPQTALGVDSIEVLPEPLRMRLLEQIDEPFQFVYNTYMMVTAYLQQRDPDLLLHRVLEWLNHPHTLDWFRVSTGVPEIRKVNAQATRYLPGHFLKLHNDHNASEGRRFAYVFSVTRDWCPDWGGLLHFTDDQGCISRTLVPGFNTLNLFQVPRDPFVSLVAPYAQRPRLAITGWLLDK